ncbi:MAG: carboxypeptidase regulatory-like domain-containing protein [Elusimicrobia bacterium]|nr:carboxypeptidase regulatory-like domain-containing protein [Elusimicrobiota bacterium]
MRNVQVKFLGLFLSLMVSGIASLRAETPLVVTVANKSGAGIAGAVVVAAEFTEKGPGTKTQVGIAGSDGNCALSLPDSPTGGFYYVFASSQAHSPTINQQFALGSKAISANGSTQTYTMTLNKDLSDVAEIVLDVTSGSASGLVGADMRRMEGSFDQPIAFGMGRLDSSGNGVIRLMNIPKDSNTVKYQANAFDVAANLHSFVEISSPIAGGAVLNFALNLKGDNALPPSVYEDKVEQAQDSGGSGGYDLSIEGVVQSTDAVNPILIPWVGIELKAYQNGYSYGAAWSNSDDQGRFKFYGLAKGTTYFVQIYSGCAHNGACFKGWQSTATQASNPNANAPTGFDFLYKGERLIKKFTLERIPAGNGKMEILVRDSNGKPIPGAHLSVSPDHTSWHTDPPAYPIYSSTGGVNWISTFTCENSWSKGQFDERGWHYNVDFSSPGLSQFNGETTGYTLITGLQPGNYQVQVWTRFTSEGINFNGGADGKWNWDWHHQGCRAESVDNLRVTVDPDRTNARGTNLFVYDSQGNDLGLSSATVVVQLKSKTGGHLEGTLDFSETADLSGSPVTIMLEKNCENDQGHDCWQGGGFAIINGVGASQSYSIDVTTGSYWMRILSDYWGVVRNHGGGDDSIKFTVVGTTITKNFSLVKAGRVTGKVYRPDGSLFKPGNASDGSWVSGWVNANGENGWGGTNIANDGSFVIGGLAPGDYEVEAEISGGEGSYVQPDRAGNIKVLAGVDAMKDIQLIDGEYVMFQASTASLPVLATTTSYHGGGYQGEIWQGLRTPAGLIFDGASIAEILFNWNGDWRDRTFYWTGGSHCEGGVNSINSWCPQRVPSNKTYDFYFMRRGDIGDEASTGTYLYFTVVNSTKNKVVDGSHATATLTRDWDPSGKGIRAVPMDLSPSASQAAQQVNSTVLRGTVSAVNFIREEQFKKLGGEPSNFFKYLPIVRVDGAGSGLVAAGGVTPSPEEIMRMDHLDVNGNGEDDFDDAIQSGDWQLFKTVIATFSAWGYEIRGLPAGSTVTVTIATPNYPPTKKTVLLGSVAGSTKTVDFNLDASGLGGSIVGAVASTGSLKIANAVVAISAKDFTERTTLSNSSGVYKFEGLPAGLYTLTVTASGFETSAKKQVITSSDSTAGQVYSGVNFSLPAVGQGEIYGKVYTKGMLYNTMQGDVKILAYNDSENRRDVTKALNVSKAVTNSTGTYSLTGLIPGDVYKLTFKKEGYRVYQATAAAVAGAIVVDVALEKKSLDLNVMAWKDDSDKKYKFLVENPSSFKDGNAWIGQAPMTSTASAVADVSDDFVTLSNNDLSLSYPAGIIDLTGVNWELFIMAYSYDGDIAIKSVVFGPKAQASVVTSLDDAMGGDEDKDDTGAKANEIALDSTGKDKSAITIPAGAIEASSATAKPTCSFVETSTSSVEGAEFFASAYEISFEDVQFTGKCIDVTLDYDTATAKGDTPVMLYYNESSKEWEEVEGQTSYDTDEGVITTCVDFTDLSGFAEPTGLTPQGHAKKSSMRALASDGYFTYNPLNASEGSGAFSVGAVVQTSGGILATKYLGYNFPNPFNLNAKTVTLRSGSSPATMSTDGTMMVIAPTGSGSVNVVISIYNVAGDRVREITGTATAGQYNYFPWDGRNDSGTKVASGVYFAVVEAPGAPSQEPIKMVVVK